MNFKWQFVLCQRDWCSNKKLEIVFSVHLTRGIRINLRFNFRVAFLNDSETEQNALNDAYNSHCFYKFQMDTCSVIIVLNALNFFNMDKWKIFK